jgi:cation diffusion facilitator family transporter
LLFGVAGFVLYEAVEHLITHAAPQRVDWGLGVMAISALMNGFVVRYIMRIARRTESEALRAAAQDHRADIYAAIGVFIGLALVRLTGWSVFDPLLAILVALLILHGAWEVVHGAATTLVDRQLPEEDLARIRQVFESAPSVRAYHKLRTRRVGPIRHVDAHVLMDDNLPLVKAHDLTEQLEAHIREALPNSVVHLHTEPYQAEERHQREEHGGPPPDEKVPAPERKS